MVNKEYHLGLDAPLQFENRGFLGWGFPDEPRPAPEQASDNFDRAVKWSQRNVIT
jgi:hypothetical protein